MDRLDRIYQLNNIIKNSRLPVSKSRLQERLECSSSTVERAVDDMRNFMGAPLIYDRKLNGYFYDLKAGEKFELPGLWFNAAELFALLASQKLLQDIQPGLLNELLNPLIQRISDILKGGQHEHEDFIQRVRLIQQASRKIDRFLFQHIISALAMRKKIQCTYHARGSDEISKRILSPQRLVNYRDNWYLDAWCHKREALRTFSIDKLISIGVPGNDAINIEQDILDKHFTSSYGIFAGEADKTAVLEFTEKYALWVADESWHPNQKGEWLENGHYRLTIPYKHSQELIMDILKYGADVKVLSPLALQQTLVQIINDMQKNYEMLGTTSQDEGVGEG